MDVKFYILEVLAFGNYEFEDYKFNEFYFTLQLTIPTLQWIFYLQHQIQCSKLPKTLLKR